MGLRCFLAIGLGLLLAWQATGQLATGGSAARSAGNEHAWAITPSGRDGQWTLWHLPPRAGPGAAEDGTARPLSAVESQPLAIAAAGGRIWIAFEGGGDRAGLGFMTAAVQRGAIEGTWYTGAGGRLAPAPFLPTTGRLLGMAAGQRGPMALVEGDEGTIHLAWLDSGRWRWVLPPPKGGPQAVGTGDKGGPILSAIHDGELHVWRAKLPEHADQPSDTYELLEPDAIIELARPRAEADHAIELDWTHQASILSGSFGSSEIVAGPVEIGRRIIVGLADDQRIRILEVADGKGRVLLDTDAGGLALLAAARRGIVVRMGEPESGAPGRTATRLVLEEFSLDTGLVLSKGPAVFDGPVSPSDLRILAVLVVLVSASLLLFVVRTSGELAPFIAPPGMVLAPPVARLMASLADGVLALFLGGELARLMPQGWLAIRVGADLLDFGPLLAALAVGYLASSILEAAFGRTPGKLLFGLLVTRSVSVGEANPSPRRPGLWASLVRNAVKWLLPIVALAGAMGPGLRHRGDAMSRLGVVAHAMPGSHQAGKPDDR